ncbi:MAG: AAA family ATPase [Phycisphaerales bacterium]
MSTEAKVPAARTTPAARAGGATVDPVKVVRRHALLLVIMAIVGIAAGFGAFQVADLYASRFTGRVGFEIVPQLANPLESAARAQEAGEAVLRAVRTETEYLTSREVLSEALRKSRDVRENTTWGRQFLNSADQQFAFDDALDNLTKHLDPVYGRDTNLFFLEWSSSSAADVPVVLNAIAESYIKIRSGREKSQFDKALDQFTKNVSELNKQISEGQEMLQEFIRKNNITAVDDARNSQLMVAVEDLLRQITQALSNETLADSVKNQTELKLRGAVEFSKEDRQEAEDDQSIRSMTQILNQQRAELQALRTRLSESHPDVVSLEERVKAYQSEREAAIRERIRRNLDSKMQTATQEVDKFKRLRTGLEEDYKIKLGQLKDTSALISDFKNRSKTLTQLEERRNQLEKSINDAAMMRARDDARRVQIAFEATTPREKSFPTLKMFLPLGAILGLGLTLAIVFLRELLDQRVKSSSDLAVIPGARVLGTIPDLVEDPTRCERTEMVVLERPQSVLAESYRQAAVPLMKSLAARESKVLAVLAAMPGAGTTTVASNIAAIDAVVGRRVLIIDANFRRPGVPRALGVRDDAPGLGDVLAGSAKVEECIQRTNEGVDALTAGTPATRIFERLNTSRLDALLAELRPQYDLIVIDAPPAVVAGEAMVLANKSDAVVLVVRANQEQRGLVARLVRQLNELRSDFTGIILNRPRGTAGGYLRKNYATIAEYARPA